jgi:eukaryotic-like serine/threonine-protein kinase
MPAQPSAAPPPGERRGSRRSIVVVVVVVLLALAGTIAAIALGGDDEEQAAGVTDEPSTTAPTSPTGTTGPSTGTTGPTGSTGTTGSSNPGCSGTPAPATLADGTYFGFLESIDVGSGVSGFDLACFYTGDEANEQAAARGEEVPVPNDVYIVNDNPSTRDVPVDPSVELLLIDWNACCETSPGAQLDAFASALGDQDFVEIDGFRYAGGLSPYWITIEEGRIVGIEEQFLP